MSRVYGRRDRTARLIKLQMLLSQNPQGLKIEEIAQRCSVTRRTAYRDLRALESELGIPVWGDGGKRGIVEGYFLPPISLSLEEAMHIFLSTRLVQKMSHLYNPDMISTFLKLNTIIPTPLKEYVQETLKNLEKQPKDERKIRNFDKLTKAWLSRRRVKILHQEAASDQPLEHTIEPYFIEPVAWGRSNYVIAYSHLLDSVYSFKTDSILGEVEVLTEIFEIPADFNAIDYLSSSWEIYTNNQTYIVKLHFSRRLSKGISETVWHPSQKAELQSDGSLIMTLRVRDTFDFRHWILGWGDRVEVLEPKVLRDQIAATVRGLSTIYGSDISPAAC